MGKSGVRMPLRLLCQCPRQTPWPDASQQLPPHQQPVAWLPREGCAWGKGMEIPVEPHPHLSSPGKQRSGGGGKERKSHFPTALRNIHLALSTIYCRKSSMDRNCLSCCSEKKISNCTTGRRGQRARLPDIRTFVAFPFE